ncbi:hypothetical protein ACTXT7_001768 [Hymenolepis weldensis]
MPPSIVLLPLVIIHLPVRGAYQLHPPEVCIDLEVPTFVIWDLNSKLASIPISLRMLAHTFRPRFCKGVFHGVPQRDFFG